MRKIITALVLTMVLALCLTGCGLTVPPPEVRTGEFDFSVTYELNGEIETVSGVYVCEYTGVSFALDGGFHRDWSGYVKGENEDELTRIGIAEDGGVIRIHLGLYPEYFMGDLEAGAREAPVPMLTVTLENSEGFYMQSEADVIEEIYGVRIIGYEYEQPIQNSFGY